jgi:hypothetical protein
MKNIKQKQHRRCHVTPPEGLWEIGERRLLMAQLDRALEPYKRYAAQCTNLLYFTFHLREGDRRGRNWRVR